MLFRSVTSPSHATQDYIVMQPGLIVVVPGTRGMGRVTGRYCYDIAVSNDGDTCGRLSTRLPRKANFSVPQVYTFTSSGSVTNVRATTEEYDGARGKIFAGTPSVNEADGKWTISVNMKEALLKDAVGLTTHNALKGAIIVVYHDGEKEVQVRGEIQVRDCACCGAQVDPDGVYLNFMCHNLGVDATTHPLMPSTKIHGEYYIFNKTTPIVSKTQMLMGSLPSASDWSDASIYSDTDNTFPDPCPDGWRLPTIDEWTSVYNGNPVDMIGDAYPGNWSSALMIGEDLMLPTGGWYTPESAGWALGLRGYATIMLSSTPRNNGTGWRPFYAIMTDSVLNRAHGAAHMGAIAFQVRCLER